MGRGGADVYNVTATKIGGGNLILNSPATTLSSTDHNTLLLGSTAATVSMNGNQISGLTLDATTDKGQVKGYGFDSVKGSSAADIFHKN